MSAEVFQGRVGLQQRVLPAYRAPLFEALARALPGGLGVFAGEPLPVEAIPPAPALVDAQFTQAHNRHFRDPSSSFYLCWQANLLDWLERWDPQALILEANPRYLSSRLAVRWMHRRGRPVLGWGLGAPELRGPLASLRRWERRTFLRSLDGLLAYSRTGAAEYLVLGVPPERVFVVPNAAVARPSGPLPPRSKPTMDRLTVLFVGRVQPRKRVDHLLRSCSVLPEALQPHLVIVGDGPARGALETLAQSLYPRAEFTGARHGAELETLFNQADLFVLPGTGGLAVQQAMAHGLPVIVAKGDGTQDDLVRPENGWQVRPDDVEALAATLRTALSEPGRLRQMGAESYRIVAEEINLEAMVEVFLAAFNKISSLGGQSHPTTI
jgi:glycosyltransferase involved in cell wall biosynthesis